MNTTLYSLFVIIFTVWNPKSITGNVFIKVLNSVLKDIIINKDSIVIVIIVSLIGLNLVALYIIIFSRELIQIVWKSFISGLIERVKNRWIPFFIAGHNNMGQRLIFLGGKGSHFEIS